MPRYFPVLCAIVLAVGHFFVYHHALLASPWRFNDDVVQHYLWLVDTPWADDFYARTSGRIQPWGYRALLRTLSLGVDPLALSRYGPLLITVLTFVYATRLFQRFFPLAIALAGAYLVTQGSVSVMLGFLARSFCIPLLLIFANYLLRRNYVGIALTMVASGLFYPPALLINGFILLAFLVGWLARRPWRTAGWTPRPYLLIVGGCLLAGLITLLQSRYIAASADFGATFSADLLGTMPEFSGAGRVAFQNILRTDTGWMLHYFMQTFVGTWPAPDFGYFLLAVAALIGALTYRRTAALGAYLLAFLVVTAGLYQLAKLLTPALFLASRYVEYPWRFGVPVLITFLVGGGWALLPRRWTTVLGAALLAGVSVYRLRPAEVSFVDVSSQSAYYRALAKLPADALVAAPPQMASYVPLLSRRAVLLGHEQAHALYFTGYYDYVTPRYTDYQNAVTTDSLPAFAAFLRTYDIDFFVLDPAFRENWGWHYFQPYKRRFEQLIAGREREDFALLRIPEEVGTPLYGELRLISRAQVDSLLTAD